MNITLQKQSIGYGNVIYVPCSTEDKYLMEHLLNEDLESLNEEGLEKVMYVAHAHGWKIEIIQ